MRRRRPPLPKRTNQRLNRGITTQPTNDQTPQKIQDIEATHPETLLISPPPPLPSIIESSVSAGFGIEGFFGEHGVLLDVEAEFQQGREGVGEVADAEGADEGGDVADVGDCRGDYVGDGPVDGDDEDPGDFAAFGG